MWDVLFLAPLVRQVEDQAAQLAALARHDGLTGMPNRRAWDGELLVAMDRARRDGVPLSVALLDLDHFKRVNDQHGHQAGDREEFRWSCPAPPPSRPPRCWSGSAR